MRLFLMPFTDETPVVPFEGQARAEPKYDIWDQFSAAMEQDNAAVALFQDRKLPSQVDPNAAQQPFDIWEHLTPEEQSHAATFSGARSQADIDFIRGRIDKEQLNREVLAHGPLNETMMGLVAGLFNPINYLPVFGEVSGVASGAALLAANSAVSAGINEGILQSRQYDRSAAESWGSIVTSALLGAGLGAAGGMLAGREGAKLAEGHSLSPGEYRGVVRDLGGLIRSSGADGRPPLANDLLGSTAVSNFLDIQPRVQLNQDVRKLFSVDQLDTLNSFSYVHPKTINNINNIAAELDTQTARLHQLDSPEVVAAGTRGFDTYINSLKYAQSRLRDIDNLGVTGDIATGMRQNVLADFKEIEAAAADKKISIDDAINQRLAEVEKQKDQQWGVAARQEVEARVAKATAQHELAQRELANQVNRWKKTVANLQDQLGPKGQAMAAAHILKLREEMTKYLENGGDPLKYKEPNVLDWMKGIAQNPEVVKAARKAAEKAKEKVVDKSMEAAREQGKSQIAAAISPEQPEPKSLSAAAVTVEHQMNQLAGSYGIAKTMNKLKKVGLAAPSLELAQSIFSTSRATIRKLADTGMLSKGNVAGLENPRNLWSVRHAMANPDIFAIDRFVNGGYADHIKAAKFRGEAPLTRKAFYDGISFALRRGDKSPIPEVEAVAEKLRAIDTKYRDLMIKNNVGVFKDVVEKGIAEIAPDGTVLIKKPDELPGLKGTAESHYLRSYNGAALRARQTEFLQMVQENFERQMLADKNMTVRDGMLFKDGKPFARAGSEDDPRINADFLAQEVYHAILGHPEGRIPWEVKVAEGRGSAKERTFRIRDDFVSSKGVRFEDFLDNNPINVMSRYVNTAASDVAYQISMGGDDGLKQILDELKVEADGMVAQLPPGASSKAIVRQYENEAQLIRGLTDQVRGVKTRSLDPRMDAFHRVLRGVRDIQALRSLGLVLASQLPDIGTASISEGFGKLFGTAVQDLVTGLKGMKMGIKQAQMVGTALDMSKMGRAGALYDLGELYRARSTAELWMDRVTHGVLNAFGIGPWTVGLKGWVSFLGGHHILDGVERLAEDKPINQTLRSQLARDGIGVAQAKLIYAEKEHWLKHNGLWLSNAEDWKNPEAKALFAEALLQRVNNAVITPNPADSPLWTGTEIGKSIFQFKKFSWASNQRLLIAGLQQNDHIAMSGMAMAVAMGIIGTALRDIAANGQVDPNRDLGGWIREGVDRSSIIAQTMELENIFDKVSGGHGLIHMATGAQPSRFASEGLIERLAGPSVSMLTDTSKALSGVADGSLTGADVHNIRRLLPLQNWFAIKYLMDRAEQNISDYYGLPSRQHH